MLVMSAERASNTLESIMASDNEGHTVFPLNLLSGTADTSVDPLSSPPFQSFKAVGVQQEAGSSHFDSRKRLDVVESMESKW
jgi:hypothetical protein